MKRNPTNGIEVTARSDYLSMVKEMSLVICKYLTSVELSRDGYDKIREIPNKEVLCLSEVKGL